MRKFILRKQVPFLQKGNTYIFDDDTGNVFDTKVTNTPLRSALSGYLWAMLTLGNRVMKKISDEPKKEKSKTDKIKNSKDKKIKSKEE